MTRDTTTIIGDLWVQPSWIGYSPHGSSVVMFAELSQIVGTVGYSTGTVQTWTLALRAKLVRSVPAELRGPTEQRFALDRVLLARSIAKSHTLAFVPH